MTTPSLNDDELVQALRAAVPGVDAHGPSRDLWADVVQRTQQRARWSLADWSAAAVIVVALLMFPKWILFLAYHL